MARATGIFVAFFLLTVTIPLSAVVSPYFGFLSEDDERTRIGGAGRAFGIASVVVGFVTLVMAVVRLHGLSNGYLLARRVVKSPRPLSPTALRVSWFLAFVYALFALVLLEALLTTLMIIFGMIELYADYVGAQLAVGGYQTFVACFAQWLAALLAWKDARAFHRDAGTPSRTPQLEARAAPAQVSHVRQSIDSEAEEEATNADNADVLPMVPLRSDSLLSAEGATAGHARWNDDKWDTRQRNIFLNVLLLFLAISIGAVILAAIEGWFFLQATYFCIVTLTTVGYGNITPTTRGGRLFVSFYIILVLGLMAAIVSATGRGFVRVIKLYLARSKLRKWLKTHAVKHTPRKSKARQSDPNIAVSTRQEDDRRNNSPTNNRRQPSPARSVGAPPQPRLSKRVGYAVAHFLYRHMLSICVILTGVCLWLLGGLAFSLAEEWSYTDGVYFSIVTLATIGYGDLIPSSQFGQAFLYWFIFLGIGVFALLFSAGEFSDMDEEIEHERE